MFYFLRDGWIALKNSDNKRSTIVPSACSRLFEYSMISSRVRLESILSTARSLLRFHVRGKRSSIDFNKFTLLSRDQFGLENIAQKTSSSMDRR